MNGGVTNAAISLTSVTESSRMLVTKMKLFKTELRLGLHVLSRIYVVNIAEFNDSYFLDIGREFTMFVLQPCQQKDSVPESSHGGQEGGRQRRYSLFIAE